MSDQEKESAVQTFNNNHLTVTVNQFPHCRVKFAISVDKAATEAAYQKAIKTVSKEVSVPGFRKGKAPSHFITDKYASAIKEEFMDAVLQNSFNEAVQLTNLLPLKNTLKSPVIKECSREKGAHFTIEFESRINPPEIELDKIKVKRVIAKTISDKDRQDAIQQLLYRLAEFKPVADRAVQENDFVNLQAVLFGELPKVIENHRVQVNADNLPNWLLKKVIGSRAGDVIEGMTEPENNNNEFIEIEEASPFKATIISVWEVSAPELNDELLKKIGLASVQELEEKMTERLQQTAFEEAFEQQTNLIERAILDTYAMDVPQSYLDEEYKIRLEEYLEPLLANGVSDYVQTNRAMIEEKIRKISIERLSIYFMLNMLAMRNKIEPSQDEISQELMRQKYLMSINRSNLTAKSKEEAQSQLYNLAMEQKIKHFLLEKVTFIED